MATDPYGSPDDGLELERIAVGPYCVFDNFQLPPSPPPGRPPPPASPKLSAQPMEDPMLSSDYPFTTMRAGPWLTTAGDEMTLPTAPADDMASWNEWMQFDPAAPSQQSQTVETKPGTNQGSSNFPQAANQQPSFNRPHQSQPQTLQHSQSMQPTTTVPLTAPMYSQPGGVPFTFGQNGEVPPAFDFNGNALSSPTDQIVQQQQQQQQQSGYFSPPIWQQQQAMNDSAFFSPSRYNQPGFVAPAPPVSTPSLHHSPTSLDNGRASSSSSHSSPEPAVTTKKRKSPSEEEDDDAESASSGKKEKGQPPKKTAHNMIEKRYRTNLNDKIAALRDSVPSLRVMSRPNGTEEDDDPEDLEGLTPAHKLNKATVLSKATEYIRHLEKRNKRMQEEINTLKTRMENYEKMAISGPITIHGNVNTPDSSRYPDDPFTPSHGLPMGGPPQGIIPVPDNIAALQRGLPPQQHYAHAYPHYAAGRQAMPGPPMVTGRRNGAMMGKLMVGSLAGLMILEGLVEREQSQGKSMDRGLGAIPFHLARVLAPQVSLGATSAQLPLAKVLLVFGALFYLIAPLLDFKPKPKRKSAPAILLSPAPSLASPIDVRRKAWLTAIQTVWVPQHNFLLELAALGLKTLKLSTRKIIGWQGYAYLTGITKDQEAARVKAWEIALDAQLAGGDAEISISRLVLTLMASGTLPDTPARLMLKALHIRVLLWEIANAGYGSWWMLDDLSAKLARRYWNMARSEHKIAINSMSKPDAEVKPLPDHLAALIERECDDVLIPSIIQRAYNLAWNRPSAEKTVVDLSMDGVVEDFAISSPLDALAAWYSSVALKKSLVGILASKSTSLTESLTVGLDLALRAAPPNSQAQLRALVAQAVAHNDDRNARIAAAFQALPTSTGSKATGLMNAVETGPVATDIRKALTLAKCLALISSSSTEARSRAMYIVNNTFLPEVTVSLLSFVAAHKILTQFMQDNELQAATSDGLERIARSLRMWIGHETGKRTGLTNKVKSRIVTGYVEATKTLVGLKAREVADEDDGYVSASVKDD